MTRTDNMIKYCTFHTQLKQHDNTVVSMDVQLHTTNKTTPPFPELLALCYFGEYWASPGIPDQTQQILHILTKASMNIEQQSNSF